MAAPLYFFPKLHLDQLRDGQGLRQSLIAERGLAHVFGDVRDFSLECASQDLRGAGPGGASGAMLVRLPALGRGLPARLGYYPQFQTWDDDGEQRYWIGLDNEERPAPADLARATDFEGYDVELGDGKKWRVPPVRRPDDSTGLPCTLRVRRGVVEEQVKAEYRAVWDRCGQAVRWFTEADPTKEDYPAAFALAADVMAIAYRLHLHELSVLGLIDSTNLWQLLGAAIDWPRIRRLLEAQKKTNPASSTETPSTSPGSAASPLITDPAAVSSSSPPSD
ncbi:MAG: hypothetical protein AB7G51_08450 [Steroidobacteraceae bacterium]